MFKYALPQSPLIWTKDLSINTSTEYQEYPNIRYNSDTISIIGKKSTSKGQRLLIAKYDLNGDTTSTIIYGNDSVSNSTLVDYKFDNENHIYLLQQEKLAAFKYKIVLQKYALDGTLIWVEQIQEVADTSYEPIALHLAENGSIFVAANKSYDYPEEAGADFHYTIRKSTLYAFQKNGTLLWKRVFDGTLEFDYLNANSMVVIKNTIFILNQLTYTVCRTNEDFRLIKVDINNNISTIENIKIADRINALYVTKDSNLLITGHCQYRITKLCKLPLISAHLLIDY